MKLVDMRTKYSNSSAKLGDINRQLVFAGIAITSAISGVILMNISVTLIRWMHGAEKAH